MFGVWYVGFFMLLSELSAVLFKCDLVCITVGLKECIVKLRLVFVRSPSSWCLVMVFGIGDRAQRWWKMEGARDAPIGHSRRKVGRKCWWKLRKWSVTIWSRCGARGEHSIWSSSIALDSGDDNSRRRWEEFGLGIISLLWTLVVETGHYYCIWRGLTRLYYYNNIANNHHQDPAMSYGYDRYPGQPYGHYSDERVSHLHSIFPPMLSSCKQTNTLRFLVPEVREERKSTGVQPENVRPTGSEERKCHLWSSAIRSFPS